MKSSRDVGEEENGRVLGRPRAATTDEAIIAATIKALAGDGYSRMSVDAIAEAAGTTKPTIYRRWSSKGELAIAALRRLQAADMPPPTGQLQPDLIAAMTDFIAKVLRPNGMAMIGTLLAEENHNPQLIALFRERIIRVRRESLIKIFKHAVVSAELPPGFDIDAAVNMLLGSVYARYLSGEPITDNWAERVVRLLVPPAMG